MKKIIIILALIVFVIGFFVWFFITPMQDLPDFLQQFKTETPEKIDPEDSTYKPVESTILYDVADFSENIYDDSEYLSLLEPYVMNYKSSDVEVALTVDKIPSAGRFAEFFWEYIDTIKLGDHKGYNAYFFDDYFTNHEKKSEFTMQKIYALSIEELQITPTLDEDEYAWVFEKNLTPLYFNVKYKIKNNNGTFRLGVSSDTYQSQLYILAEDGDEIKIIDIVTYTPVYA